MRTAKTVTSLAFTFALVACAADGADPQGLELSIERPDHIAGTFTRDQLTLGFESYTGPDARLTVLETRDGDHIMSRLIAGGVETVNILDGRLSISGETGSRQRTMVGDPEALNDMMEMPELTLLPALRTELVEQGISADLQPIVR